MKELLQLQLRLEFRRKSILTSLVLYLVSLVLIIYLTIGLQPAAHTPGVWSALFWMTILFTTVNAVAKSFVGEREGMGIYMYSLASATQIILSRILYGFLLSTAIMFAGYLLFSVLISHPVEDEPLFIVTLVLAAYSFSASLTLLSAIAAKTNNSAVVMAVLSFPVIISTLLMVIKITKNCLDGLERAASYDEVWMLVAINILVTALSYLLFPYIWRS